MFGINFSTGIVPLNSAFVGVFFVLHAINNVKVVNGLDDGVNYGHCLHESGNVEQCYALVKIKKTWNEAKGHCEKNDGKLTEVLDKNQASIMKMFQESIAHEPPFYGNFWIGGTDEAQEGNWRWAASGAQIPHRLATSGFEQWKDGQPNNNVEFSPPDENCLMFQAGEDDGNRAERWNDKHCDIRTAFVCQRTKDEPVNDAQRTSSADSQVKASVVTLIAAILARWWILF